ncbi:MAG: zinc-dependent alcohol dehydrogenase family protein [Alphaproteobacteria bacterium]|nr:zinc-dependent alcohol dehydrogenase family protein [Alphaproteobacteria bacterium]
MRAALFEAFRAPLGVVDIAAPTVPADGAVVRVEACGVCRSDWHGWMGTDPDVSAPHVPGHEFAGTIEAVGLDCRRFAVGDRVTAPFILACGVCAVCRAGDPTVCDDQFVIGFSAWGAFAEMVAVPRADFNLVAVPESLDAATAAGLGCRVTTAFRALVDRARLQPGEWLAVHGCGGVGLSAVMIAEALGAPVIAVDIDERKLTLARALGATATVDASAIDNVGAALRDATGGGADVSIDALGITATFHNSLYGLRKLGRHVQIGLPLEDHAVPTIPLQELIYARQLTVMGTRGIPAARFAALFEMIAAGRLDPARLVTRRISLDEAGGALAGMGEFEGVGVTVIDRF